MANIYVRSTDGDNGESGATWALAKATLAGASAIAVAGDVIWVSQVHSESTAAAIPLDWNGTNAAPTRILCGNDAAEPPTALATTAVIATTGANGIRTGDSAFTGDWFYMYGLTFRAGVGSSGSADIIMNGGAGGQIYEQCVFEIATTNNAAHITASGGGGFGETLWKECDVKFAHAEQFILSTESAFTMRGGSLLSGTSPTVLLSLASSGVACLEGCDLSTGSSTMHLSSTSSASGRLQVRNCKLPASWTGSVNNSTPGSGGLFELYNADSSDANYHYHRKTQFGLIDGEQTVVRSGGSTDGIRQISWKMTTNANPQWNHLALSTARIVRWNATVGSAITATIEILHDSLTNMTNQQIWLDVQYLGTNGVPLGSFLDDSSGDYLSSAADQTDSSATWDTTGLTNPNTQKLHVTFTPQEQGFLSAVVYLALASKTVYVDPKLEMS